MYMDEHVHRAIVTGLRMRGVDVLTAQEDGRRNVPDEVLLDRATQLRRVQARSGNLSGLRIKIPATSYSPTQLPAQYHRLQPGVPSGAAPLGWELA